MKGVSWWTQEQPGNEAEAQVMQAASDNGYSADFIFTHEAAVSDYTLLGHREPTRINYFLEEMKAKVQYRHWFFGHYHDNVNLPGNREHLIYEQIIRIG